MKHRIVISLIFAAAVLLSCGSSPSDYGSRLSPAAFSLAQEAVFEVVQKKPGADATVYEKELDWTKIPYNIRIDEYYSIGTAFAISANELVTAFHVIDLGFESRIYDKYFIRGSGGEVFEVDQILGGSKEKDYLIFTVKDKTFSSFFQFERNFREGDLVYSIGNALGEGIVIRDGLVLGTIPEEDSGRWNLLKTSASGNPGNSGGPLVTPAGKVVSLITARQDNILYSLPASVILDSGRSKLEYRLKLNYQHLILANTGSRTFEAGAALPGHYQAIRSSLVSEYQKDYNIAMSSLFNEAPEYLSGPNNMWILNSTMSTVFPRLDFVDPDDNEWTLSDLPVKNYNLTDDGLLIHSDLNVWNIYKINKPKTVGLAESLKPRYIMDTILRNIRRDRNLGSDTYRILSYGDPGEVSSYSDLLGRKWITAEWLLDFSDQILIMYILPLPNGPAVITGMQGSAFRDIYEWDLRKICDHLWAAYSADFDGWNEFSGSDYVPPVLENLNFRWQAENQRVSFNAEEVSVSVNSSVYDWSGNSELFLGPSYYQMDGKVQFGIRRIVLNKDARGKESVSMIKRLRPDSRLPAAAMESWNDVAGERFPFDGVPVISARDNEGAMGAVLKAPSEKEELRYTIYLSMENPQNEGNVQSRFTAFKNGIRISDF